jgi:hypothetical protein
MRTLRQIVVFLPLIFLWTSCEDVVQVKLDQGAKLYVIDAFINDLREPQVIKLTTSDAYFSNQASPPLEGATVLVKDLTAGRNFSFTPAGAGIYRFVPLAGDTLGKTGHQYQLLVQIGNDTYSSLSTQKRKAGAYMIFAEDISGGPFGPVDSVQYMCTLYAKDPSGGETDYYWLKTFRNDSLLFTPTDINVAIDGTNGPVTAVESDSTEFTPPSIFLGFRPFRPGNTCKVEIHSISRDTYFFFIQAINQVNNSGLFATTPENVKTNILTPAGASVKAVGRFEVSGVSSVSVSLP